MAIRTGTEKSAGWMIPCCRKKATASWPALTCGSEAPVPPGAGGEAPRAFPTLARRDGRLTDGELVGHRGRHRQAAALPPASTVAAGTVRGKRGERARPRPGPPA